MSDAQIKSGLAKGDDIYAELQRRLNARGNVAKFQSQKARQHLMALVAKYGAQGFVYLHRPQVFYSREDVAWAIVTGQAVRLPIEKNIRFGGAL